MSASKKSHAKKPRDDEDDVKVGAVRPDEMAPDAIEFITAIDAYKRTHRRPFPTWGEVLDVVKSLGYVRTGEPLRVLKPAAGTSKRLPRRRSA